MNEENTLNHSITLIEDRKITVLDESTSAMKPVDDDAAGATTILPPPQDLPGTRRLDDPSLENKKGLPVRIQFHVRESGAVLETAATASLTIGRRNSTMPVDIDLADYNAIEMGISRNHVRIQPAGNTLTVVDLNSVNGTTLNGEPLKPNRAYELRDGDILKPGRLHLKVYFIYGR